MPPISSTGNRRIKAIRALQHRAERDRTGLFFVDGRRTVEDAMRHGAPIEVLVLAPDMMRGGDLAGIERGAYRRLPRLEVSARVYESLARSAALAYGPQGIGAVVRQRVSPLPVGLLPDPSCWVALATPQNPGNVGTVLRTCDAVGASGVILVGPSTDPYDPAAVRASMGAIFSQQLVRTTLEELWCWTRRAGITVVGTSPDAEHDYRAHHYRAPIILLMGNERSGLSPSESAACDALVSIPMVGSCNSLNLGVATGVVLYEIFEQRRRRLQQ